MKNEAGALARLGIPGLTATQMTQEVACRIRCARLWCQRHWHVLTDSNLKSSGKFQLYALLVRPILAYGCEVWPYGGCALKRLSQFEAAILTEIFKSKYHSKDPKRLKVKKVTVYSRYKYSDIATHIENERLRWNELLPYEETALRGPNPNKKKVRFKEPIETHERTRSNFLTPDHQPFYISKLRSQTKIKTSLQINDIENHPG